MSDQQPPADTAPTTSVPLSPAVEDMERVYLSRLCTAARSDGLGARLAQSDGRPVRARLWDTGTAGRRVTIGCSVEWQGPEFDPHFEAWFTHEEHRFGQPDDMAGAIRAARDRMGRI